MTPLEVVRSERDELVKGLDANTDRPFVPDSDHQLCVEGEFWVLYERHEIPEETMQSELNGWRMERFGQPAVNAFASA